MFKSLFHRVLASARAKLGITQRELEELTKIGRVRLFRLEKGLRRPNATERRILRDALPAASSHLLHSHSRPKGFLRTLKDRGRKFLPKRLPYFPPADRISGIRLGAAIRKYPETAKQLLTRVRCRRDFEEINFFCDSLSIGSSLECMQILGLLARGASPITCPPSHFPTRLPNPVVCPRTKEFVGHRDMPGFELNNQVWIPQVSFLTPRLYTVDFLHYCSLDGWSIIEIDGRGHGGAEDEARSLALKLPVKRFDEFETLRFARASLQSNAILDGLAA